MRMSGDEGKMKEVEKKIRGKRDGPSITSAFRELSMGNYGRKMKEKEKGRKLKESGNGLWMTLSFGDS